jgi:outer membrane lipoprotein-sorting protein
MRRKRRTESGLGRASGRAVGAALLLLAVAMTPSICVAQSDSAGGAPGMTAARNIIDRIVERYESEDSYRITFSQESYWALADTTIVSDGVLLLERPSMLSVRYNDGSTITSDGDTLWVYMSGTNQYFVTDIDADDTVIDPPRVLRQYVPDADCPYSGPVEASADAGGEASPVSAVTRATLFLVPSDATGEPSRLEVTVDPSRSLVTGMVARTRSGDFTRYRISETLFGVETSPSDFERAVPAGAERVGG